MLNIINNYTKTKTNKRKKKKEKKRKQRAVSIFIFQNSPPRHCRNLMHRVRYPLRHRHRHHLMLRHRPCLIWRGKHFRPRRSLCLQIHLPLLCLGRDIRRRSSTNRRREIQFLWRQFLWRVFRHRFTLFHQKSEQQNPSFHKQKKK